MSNAFSGATGSVTFNGTVSEVKNWNITPKADLKDASSFSSAGWREKKTCMKEWSGSFEVLVYPGDCVGSQAIGSFFTGTGQPGGGTGTQKTYSGTVNIAQCAIDTKHDDLITWKIDFESHGALTIA